MSKPITADREAYVQKVAAARRNQMSKPITVEREEYLQKIIAATNEAVLPAFVKIDVLSNIIRSLDAVAMQEYQTDKAAMEKESGDKE